MRSTFIFLGSWVMIVFNPFPTRGQEFDTTNGRVRGKTINVLGKSVDVFHGIPFARPPVGDLRFMHPKPVGSWRPNVKDATKEMPSCVQSDGIFNILPADDLRPPQDFSEDCLYLSIWKPSYANAGSNLAVMLWIYGGGFSSGSTRIPLYNGQYLAAENDVIVVSVNYRLGPLGFMYLGPDTIPGNMGLMDQLEAMKWVQENIGYFGGNKDKITLFGESAGSWSVGYHLLSNLSRPFFNNGILQSGSPVSSVIGLTQSDTIARKNVKHLSKTLKCSGWSDADVYECLKKTDSQDILRGSDELSAFGVTFYPVIDGYFLPTDPLSIMKMGDYKKTNILAGITKDETSLYNPFFINIQNKSVASSGELFGSKHLEMALTMMTGLTDIKRLKAMKYFYVSERSPPREYLVILNDAATDLIFRCPTFKLTSAYSESNSVYLYSLNHRSSKTPFPEWMGVPHGFDLEHVFGRPLNATLQYPDEERLLTRAIMTYWSNFAKSGNPNLPVSVTANWPAFNKETLSYMALDVGSKLASQQGFRRHQCAFVNHILPMIPKDTDTSTPVTDSPVTFPTSGSRQVPGCVYVIVSLLTLSFWSVQR